MEKRLFTPEDKRKALERQDFLCGGGCGTDLWQTQGKGQGHHIVPWSLGGSTEQENLVVLCQKCHLYHDTLAMCGTIYGGYDITEADDTQIRDAYKFEEGTFKVRKNDRNPEIRKTIWKYRDRAESYISDREPVSTGQFEVLTRQLVISGDD